MSADEKPGLERSLMTSPSSELSQRLSEILKLVTQGRTNNSIGRELGLSGQTVNTHVRQLLRIFGVSNRTALASRHVAAWEEATGSITPSASWDLLTAREKAVVELAMRGMSNSQIADELSRSEDTVKSHLTRVYEKLGINSRTALSRALAAVPSSEE